jgi:hypothetical protein
MGMVARTLPVLGTDPRVGPPGACQIRQDVWFWSTTFDEVAAAMSKMRIEGLGVAVGEARR